MNISGTGKSESVVLVNASQIMLFNTHGAQCAKVCRGRTAHRTLGLNELCRF